METHTTHIMRTPGGFVFKCLTCGYQAIYTVDRAGNSHLEIEFGIDNAAHTSSPVPRRVYGGLAADPEMARHEREMETLIDKYFGKGKKR